MITDQELMRHNLEGDILKAKNMRYHAWHIAPLGDGKYCLYDSARDLHTIGTAVEVMEQFPCIPTTPQPREVAQRPEYLLSDIDLSALEIDIDLDF